MVLLFVPKINPATNKLPSNIKLETASKDVYIPSVKNLEKYPVYELNIASGKYSADSIVNYLQSELGNIQSSIYDYSKGIFYKDTLIQKFVDLNNEYGINQENKFTIFHY